MAKIFFRLIQKKLKTIEDVPKKYRQDVQALLDTDNTKESEG